MEIGLGLQRLLPSFWLASTISVLVATPAFAQVVQVTGVRLEASPSGAQVILETDSDTIPQVSRSSSDNSVLTDIFNTQLRLPDGQAFRQDNPVAGIATVTVTQQYPNTIRVTVTGTTEVPTVKVSPGTTGLVLNLSVPDATAQTPSTETPELEETETDLGVEPEVTTPPSTETPAPEETETDPGVEPEVTTSPEDELEAPTAEPELDDEIEIVVTGEQDDDDYFAPDASTATRTDTPIIKIPRSIQVIPQQVIEDQQVIELDEALRNVSGVINNGTDTASDVRFSIRGFEDAPVLQDGFRQYGEFQQVPETAIIERIEVLRGPASILYGEIEPGGVINVVTKQPLRDPFYETQLQVGSFGLVRPQLDISGPVNTDGSVLYRLNAFYEHDNGFRDFDQEFDQFFVAPILRWEIGDRTNLTFEFQFSDREEPSDSGTLAFGDGVIDTPRERIFGQPDDFIERNFLNIGYTFEHEFNDNLSIRNAFRFADSSIFSDKLTIPFFFDEDNGLLTQFFALDDFDSQNYSLQTNLVGKFATGPVEHTLLFGVDLNRTNTSQIILTDPFSPNFLNVFDPDYGVDRPDLNVAFADNESETDRLGIYLQDQIEILDNLNVLLGLRYDTVEQETTVRPSLFDEEESESTRNDDALTPQVGIIYEPIENFSLYASYSQSFTPNTGGFTVEGDTLEPERGEGFEVGIKTELLEGNLLATLTYFDITKQNVATADPDFPGLNNFVIATGEQRSRGVEFDVLGEILPGWNIIVSYTYTDAEITEDESFEVGNRLAGIPKHSANLWTTYRILRGNLQGLGFGVGFNYLSGREGDLANSFELDSYFLTNAAIFYRRNNWRLAVNFNNIFDIDYTEGTPFSRLRGAIPGEPFNVIGSISVEF